MNNVAAIRMQQSGVQFYQAWLTANDIDTLVRFAVLNSGKSGKGVRGKVRAASATSKFETNGEWKRSGTTVESLTKELKLALQHPEGAAG